MKREIREKVLGGLALLAGAILIGTGATARHKVYDAAGGEYGVRTFHKITERELIADTTIGGVTRHGGKLLSTYDRTGPRGKRACPT
jgi:hypothetical protein